MARTSRSRECRLSNPLHGRVPQIFDNSEGIFLKLLLPARGVGEIRNQVPEHGHEFFERGRGEQFRRYRL